MAQYIKFRLTAAKVGVSMALAALIAGIAEKVHAAPPVVRAQPAAVDSFLELGGVTGESKTDFLKLELKYNKLNTVLLKLDSKLSKIYNKSIINADFLKISTANSEFLKVDDANADFLKVDDASAEYLKIADASAKFLKLDGTAANSNELGGLTPDAFFQGHGNVVSGEATASSQHPATLLTSPDGLLSITVEVNGDGFPSLVVDNGASTALPAVQDLGTNSPGSTANPTTTAASTSLARGNNSIQLQNGVSQLTLQIFPAGNSTQITTVTVSVEPGATTGTFLAVGQMLNGGS